MCRSSLLLLCLVHSKLSGFVTRYIYIVTPVYVFPSVREILRVLCVTTDSIAIHIHWPRSRVEQAHSKIDSLRFSTLAAKILLLVHKKCST